ncbi:MAG TPA: NAD(P)/FAD-dependent oxidoreductase, partial [Acidimicrobiales bacterium]|nr:NAD(P)/FAD-dependent oxidoreductase [Acidimicrobiales bacterium]
MAWDVVVVGAGHNGLTCAAYLARAGLAVTVLERRSLAGGCAASEEALGARLNLCNCDHSLVRVSGVVEELELATYGLSYLELSPARHHLVSAPGGQRRSWAIFEDPDRTLGSLSRCCPSQLGAYRAYLEDTLPAARLLLELANLVPGPSAAHLRAAWRHRRGASALVQLSRLSLAQALARWFSDETLLAPAAAVGPAVWGLSPHSPGTGLAALAYSLTHLAPPGRPVGGSGALTSALARALEAAGGRLRLGAEVATIECRGGRVAGVRLGTGELVSAPSVVSAADPALALGRWLRDPPAGARGLLRRWAGRPQSEGYEAKVDAVVSGPPTYRADPSAGRSGSTVVLSPGLAGIVAAHAAAGQGRVAANPILFANVPSLADPAVAPGDGGHTFSLEVLFAPYRLRGGWATSREPQRWLEVLDSHTTGGFLSTVRRWRAMTPRDYEDQLGLVRGHAPSYPAGPIAALLGRDRELSRYRTLVPGLYLTGAGTFPGAGVWGASGRNAARVVLADLEARARAAWRRPLPPACRPA